MVPSIKLTRQGPSLSRLVAGMWRLADWQFSERDLGAYLARCLELGLTSFDHADIYGESRCEAMFGQWLARHQHLRDGIQLVSKCGIKLPSAQHRVKHYDLSREHITTSVENSLAALNTDYLDLLLLHRPDPLMEPDEIAEAFDALKRAGKVRYFGVSNFSPSQFALLASRTELVTNQVECSLLHTQPLFDGSFDQCQQLGVAPMIWSPLAGGRLFDSAAPAALCETLAQISQRLGISQTTLAYAWLLRHPAWLVPIVGSRRVELLEQAVAALEVSLDRQDWFALLEAAQGEEVA